MIGRFGTLVSCEPRMLEIFAMMEKVAPTDASVLVLGESGTGKELMAKAVHAASRRRDGPIVIVNCAAIPENLIESELFGHVKGAFTGAGASRMGKFEAASGGTIFLDEIGDMSLATQAKILRVLEDRHIEAVGENRRREVDVRVIAATNKDLFGEVSANRFRQDLYYRLNDFGVTLPPLRERHMDLHLIIDQMMEEYNKEFGKSVSGLSVSALGVLQNYHWPGNIRELRNVIRRAIILCEGDQIWIEHLPVLLQSKDPSALLPDEGEALVPLRDVERRYIERVLRHTGGNKSQAARILQIDRSTLYEKIRLFRLEV